MENQDNSQLTSLKILIEGIKIAQKRGVYTLEESSNLWNAIKIFIDNDSDSDQENVNNENQQNKEI